MIPDEVRKAPWFPTTLEEAQALMRNALGTERAVQKMYGSGPPVLACRPTTKLYAEILDEFEARSKDNE